MKNPIFKSIYDKTWRYDGGKNEKKPKVWALIWNLINQSINLIVTHWQPTVRNGAIIYTHCTQETGKEKGRFGVWEWWGWGRGNGSSNGKN